MDDGEGLTEKSSITKRLLLNIETVLIDEGHLLITVSILHIFDALLFPC